MPRIPKEIVSVLAAFGIAAGAAKAANAQETSAVESDPSGASKVDKQGQMLYKQNPSFEEQAAKLGLRTSQSPLTEGFRTDESTKVTSDIEMPQITPEVGPSADASLHPKLMMGSTEADNFDHSALHGDVENERMDPPQQGEVVELTPVQSNVCEQLGVPFGLWDSAVSFVVPSEVNIRTGMGLNNPLVSTREAYANGVIATPGEGGWLQIWGSVEGQTAPAAVAGFVLEGVNMQGQVCAVLTEVATEEERAIPEGFTLVPDPNAASTEAGTVNGGQEQSPDLTAAPVSVPGAPEDSATGTAAPAVGEDTLGNMGTLVAPGAEDGAREPILLNVPVIGGVPTLLTPLPPPGLSSLINSWYSTTHEGQRAALQNWNVPVLNREEIELLTIGDKQVPLGLIENPALYNIPMPSRDGLVTVSGFYRGISRLENSSSEGYVYLVDTEVDGQWVRLTLVIPNNPDFRSNFGRIVPGTRVTTPTFTPTSEILSELMAAQADEPFIFQLWRSRVSRPGDIATNVANVNFLDAQRESLRSFLADGSTNDMSSLGVGVADAVYLPMNN